MTVRRNSNITNGSNHRFYVHVLSSTKTKEMRVTVVFNTHSKKQLFE